MKILMAVIIAGSLIISAQAFALSITPSTLPQWNGDTNPTSPSGSSSQAKINNVIFPIMALYGVDNVAYKSDAPGNENPQTEEGALVDSYNTVFFPDPTDATSATISYTGGAYLTGTSFLLVKDGRTAPQWYLFNLTGWDGVESLELTGFWPNNGAISHVSLYGGSTPVPEPGTIVLLGAGLLGLGLYGRKRAKK